MCDLPALLINKVEQWLALSTCMGIFTCKLAWLPFNGSQLVVAACLQVKKPGKQLSKRVSSLKG